MQHPELKDGEVFIGNREFHQQTPAIPDDLASLKTLRIGHKAYDINDRALISDIRPLIISKAELPAYNAIREAQFQAIKKGR